MATMPVNIPRQVGLYVARSRKAQGITRAKLAELAGVSERSLASLEVGDATGIRLDKLLAIYDALGLSLLTQGEGIDESKSNSDYVLHTAQVSANKSGSSSQTSINGGWRLPQKSKLNHLTWIPSHGGMSAAYQQLLNSIVDSQGIQPVESPCFVETRN